MTDHRPSSHLPPIDHLGAEHAVTGSCHLVRTHGLNILFDCGLAQGEDAMRPLNQWPVPPAHIDYVFLTHAHVDHCGRLPMLVKQGFRGEILTTHPTRLLVVPMIRDAMGFPEMDIDDQEALLERLEELIWGFEFGRTFDLRNNLRFTFKRAGHILGSAFVHLQSREPRWSIIFSGDLGSPDQPILVPPEPPPPCDLLILESTYGDTLHGHREDRAKWLGAVLEHALADRGKVLIPAFALGRTQQLLHDLGRLASDPALLRRFPHLGLDAGIPVFLDTPLGIELTKIYNQLADFWDTEARQALSEGEGPLDLANLYSAATTREHDELLALPGPHIVIAGSGMCTGGRIIDHLKRGIEDPRNDIVFVGYQAEGTPGRYILEHANQPGARIALEDQAYAIRAKVHRLSGYSAHADQRELAQWVNAMPGRPGAIKLVHGEKPAREALADLLRTQGHHVLNDDWQTAEQ